MKPQTKHPAILPPKPAMRANKLFKNQNMDKTIGDLVQVGFKVTIEIECEDEQEILAHLAAIRREYKKHLKSVNGIIPEGVDLQWEDNNCYGTHEVKIEPDFR